MISACCAETTSLRFWRANDAVVEQFLFDYKPRIQLLHRRNNGTGDVGFLDGKCSFI